MRMVDAVIGAWQFWLAFAGLSGIIIRLWTQLMAFKRGMLALLRDRLVNEYTKWIDRHFCPIYARENIESLYVQYHRLGGNGTVTDLYHKIMALPTEAHSQMDLD